MMGVALAGALTSLALGWWWGSTTYTVSKNPPNLQSLQERIMHAKNLSMRMEELLRKEQQLMNEQASYTTLLSLKEETEWMLGLVESRLMEGGSSDLEHVEALLDATGKTLRLVLDIGQRPHMPWTTLQPNLIHIHKTLCLASRNQLPKEIKIESHLIEDEFDGPLLVQLLIQQHRQNNVGLTWPFSAQRGRLHYESLNGRRQVLPAVDPLTWP
jgi:hypothetical protein